MYANVFSHILSLCSDSQEMLFVKWFRSPSGNKLAVLVLSGYKATQVRLLALYPNKTLVY